MSGHGLNLNTLIGLIIISFGKVFGWGCAVSAPPTNAAAHRLVPRPRTHIWPQVGLEFDLDREHTTDLDTRI